MIPRHIPPEPEGDFGPKIIYEPEGILPYLNIVFIHGLGRTSTETWTKEEQQSHAWQARLREHGPLRMARVWTADYHAAKFYQTLFSTPHGAIKGFVDSLWGKLANNKVPSEMQIPVVFIAHSTGGIVVKQAYLSDLQSLVRSTSAILFLATPHKAAALRPSLTWGLEKYLLEGSTDEDRVLSTLQEINNSFGRKRNDGLYLASFSEKVKTRGAFIVDPVSSRLGLERETKMSIRSDHENIPRFLGRNDSGFEKVHQQLQLILYCQSPFKRRAWSLSRREKADLLHRLLGVDDAPHELNLLYDQYVPGTCEWIESDSQYIEWLDDDSPQPQVLSLSGLPGSGKSVLVSYIVRRLKDRDSNCQFFFFRHDDYSKQSTISLFRSFASQLADQFESYRDYAVTLAAGGYDLGHYTQDLVWNKLFTHELPSLLPDREIPLYWVVDGLDICESSTAFLSGLADPALSSMPLRVLIASRSTPALSNALDRLSASVQVTTLDIDAIDAKRQAMVPLVRTMLQPRNGTLAEEAVNNGRGSFLEIDRIVRGILRGRPPLPALGGLDTNQPDSTQYWREVASEMSAGWSAGVRAYAKNILTLVTYARYPLTIGQVHEAITQYRPTSLNQQDPIQLCSPLLQVDGQSRVTIRHRTAYEYLTVAQDHDLCYCPFESHAIILSMALRALGRMSEGDVGGQSQPSSRIESWTEYAVTSWEFHLSRCDASFDSGLSSLIQDFLDGPAVVWWIFILARSDRLSLLVGASAATHALSLRRCTAAANSNEDILDGILSSIAIELARISGRFGSHLLRCPQAIYDVVPAFCPRTSIIRKQVAVRNKTSGIVVRGVPDDAWDDTLARIPINRPSMVVCTNQYIALSSSGSNQAKLVSTSNPCDTRLIQHEGTVIRMRFSNSGHMLALSSLRTISIWQVDVWFRRWTFAAPPATPMIDMAFEMNDTALVACFQDGNVWRYPLDDFVAGSRCLGSALAVGTDGNHRVPSVAAFNYDATMLATAYRNLPMSIWEVTRSGLREPRVQHDVARRAEDWARDPVTQIDWTPSPCHVLSVRGGSAYRWDPNRQVEHHICDGLYDISYLYAVPASSFIVTTSGSGLLRVWESKNSILLHQLDCRYAHHVSSENNRLYVLRRNSCDVLSPTCLLTYRDPVGGQSKVSLNPSRFSAMSRPAGVSIVPSGGIELLAVAPKSGRFCTAHSGGKFVLSNTDGTPLIALTPTSSLTVTHLLWSQDEKYLAVVDVSLKLSVKCVLDTSPWLVTIVETTLSAIPNQVLFNEANHSVLATLDEDVVFCGIEDGTVLRKRTSNTRLLWLVNHPLDSQKLLGFASDGLHILWWDNLEHISRFPFRIVDIGSVPHQENNTTQRRIPLLGADWQVSKLFVSPNGSRIMIRIKYLDKSCAGLLCVKTADIETAQRSANSNEVVTCYLQSLDMAVDRPVGFLDDEYGQSVVAFLHSNGWVCTIVEDRRHVEHFFLPHDWLDNDSLEQACITGAGTMLIPKGECVGLVVHGFR